MKYWKILFILLLFGSIFSSCTTAVQTRFNPKIPKGVGTKDTTSTITVIDQTQPGENIVPPKGNAYAYFLDTLEIDLSKHPTFPAEISRGDELFLGKDYKNAIATYSSFINRTDTSDYFFWYARVKIAECILEMKHFDLCIEELTEVINSENIKPNIKAKAIYLLGQIYCLLSNKEKSQFYYEMLKKEFPLSPYSSKAVCQ